jgi:hypothetical protein
MPTVSVDLTTLQANRAQSAFGKHLSLKDAQGAPRDATAGEIKGWVIRQMRGVVHTQERRGQESVITDVPFDPT